MTGNDAGTVELSLISVLKVRLLSIQKGCNLSEEQHRNQINFLVLISLFECETQVSANIRLA